MTNLPLFSIIIPVHNGEKYINDIIKDFANQGIDNNEYEVIFINNASTDKTDQIIKKNKNNNPFIKLITTKKLGVSNARNLGIDNAKGEYLWFVDCDDRIIKNSLLTFKNELLKDKTTCDLLTFNTRFCNENNAKEVIDSIPSFDISNLTLAENSFCNLTRHLFNRKRINDFNLRFNENMIMAEDTCFTVSFCTQIDFSTNHYLTIDSIHYIYVSHSNSTMATIYNKKFELATSYFEASKIFLELFKKYPNKILAGRLMWGIKNGLDICTYLSRGKRKIILEKYKENSLLPCKDLLTYYKNKEIYTPSSYYKLKIKNIFKRINNKIRFIFK